MNFGIEDFLMYTIEHYLLQAKLLKVFQNSKQSMTKFAKDVRKGRIQRRHFLAAKEKPKEF